jgi:hypothetical protein
MNHTLTITREIEIDYDYTPSSPGSYLVPPVPASVYIRSAHIDGEEVKLPPREIRRISDSILDSPPQRDVD